MTSHRGPLNVPANRLCRLVLTVWVTLAGVGCAHSRSAFCISTPATAPQGTIFVSDGAGDFRRLSKSLRDAVAAERLPLTVDTFVWSHGYFRILADQMDETNICVQGRRLAALVIRERQLHPEVPVYLLSHCAGSAVVLAAV